MSSVRINASNSGSQAPPAPSATPRADDGAGFAAALGGATNAGAQPPSDPPSNPDDQPAANASGTPSDAAAAAGNDATSSAMQPAFAGWAAAAADPTADGAPPATGRHGSAKPDAQAASAAAAAIAAALATPAAPAAAVTKFAGAATEATLPAAEKVDTAAPPTDDGAGQIGLAVGSPHDPGLRAPDTIAADPSTAAIAADLSAPAVTQAASPAHLHFDPAALAVAAPAAAAAALVAPVAAAADGSGTHDFNDGGRDAQAAAAAAFDGVASAGMGPSGELGASSIDASALTAPSAATSTDAAAANVAAQISGQVLRLLASSGHEAVVRLYPPDLGEVTVRVAVSGRDVNAWFGATQPDAQQTISLGLGQLQADLGNAGYNLNGAWVGADTSGFGPRGGSAPPPTAIDAAPAVTVTPAAAALSSNTGVSIYV